MHISNIVCPPCNLNGIPIRAGDEWATITAAQSASPDIFFLNKHIEMPQFGRGLLRMEGNGAELQKGGPCRVLLANAAGTGYGDAICGSSAIRGMYLGLKDRGYLPEIDLLCMPHAHGVYREIFSRDPHVHGVFVAGIPIADFSSYHLIGTAEALLDDQGFQCINMIDYFFLRYGIESTTARLPKLYPDQAILDEVNAGWGEKEPDEKPLLLFNLFGSGFRRLPTWSWGKICEMFLADGWRIALSGGNDAANAIETFVKLKCGGKPISSICSIANRSWSHFVALANIADAIVTPDSSLLHVAAALDKPCVGIFSCIEPWLRIQHYKKCMAWTADSFCRGPYWGMHKPRNEKQDCRKLELDPGWDIPWRKADLSGIRRTLQTVWQKWGTQPEGKP